MGSPDFETGPGWKASNRTLASKQQIIIYINAGPRQSNCLPVLVLRHSHTACTWPCDWRTVAGTFSALIMCVDVYSGSVLASWGLCSVHADLAACVSTPAGGVPSSGGSLPRDHALSSTCAAADFAVEGPLQTLHGIAPSAWQAEQGVGGDLLCSAEASVSGKQLSIASQLTAYRIGRQEGFV